nr:neurofilament light polypeptide-like [Coffea arabica]
MVTTASNTAFVAEMAHRYCELLEEQDTGKLQDQIAKLKKKQVVSESEKSELQRRLQEAETKEEEADATINSLSSALERSRKEDFRRSETFIGDLGQLTRPTFMLGFTSAIDDAATHIPSEALESLRNSANYNEDSKELCDRMAEGIQAGRNLAEVQDEFNKWLAELDEVFEEEGGEEVGGDVGEEGAEEQEGEGEGAHPDGEEAGEATGQGGTETES